MVAYNFQTDFAPDILSGRKLSTIRPNGKRRHAVAGDELQLYVGMRTSSCRLLLRVPCIGSRPIEIRANSYKTRGAICIAPSWLAKLAYMEGFADWHEMRDWFDNRYGLPAVGFTQIRWDFAAATFHTESADAGGSAP